MNTISRLISTMHINLTEDSKPVSKYRKQTRVIIRRGDKIGVIYTWGKFEIPGGGFGKDETPEKCAYREVREETQTNIKNIKRIKTVKYKWPDIYAGNDPESLDENYKKRLEFEKREGNKTYFLIADYKCKAKGETGGPADDKYRMKWMSVDAYINYLKNQIKKEKIEWIRKYLRDIIKILEIMPET